MNEQYTKAYDSLIKGLSDYFNKGVEPDSIIFEDFTRAVHLHEPFDDEGAIICLVVSRALLGEYGALHLRCRGSSRF